VCALSNPVAIRLRPQSEDGGNGEKRNRIHEDKRAWNIERGAIGGETLVSQKGHARKVDGKTMFSFQNVFDEETKTPTVYKSVCRQLGRNVVKGKHATIIAYGQSGSGKTYTLQGEASSSSSSSSAMSSPNTNDGGQAGIIQLAVADLFRSIKRKSTEEHEFRVKVSYLEIYQDGEKMKDLFWDVEGETACMTDDDNDQATTNVKHIIVSSSEEVLDLLSHGNFQKKLSETVSTIFRLTVESIELLSSNNYVDETNATENTEKVIERLADFDFVDLAASDSLHVSSEENLVLTSPMLSQILHLQDSEIALLACASSSKAFVREAKETFQLAFKAQTVMTTPTLNELINDLEPSFVEGDIAEESIASASESEMPDDDMPDAPKQHESMVSMDVDEVFPSLAVAESHGRSDHDAAAHYDADKANEPQTKSTMHRCMKKETNPADSTDLFHLSESVNMESDDLEGLKSEIALHLSSVDRIDSIVSAVVSPPKKDRYSRFDSPNNRTYVTSSTDDESFSNSVRGGSQASTIDNFAARVNFEQDRSESLSWDTMMLNAARQEHVGRPIQSPAQNQDRGDDYPPEEVTVLCTPTHFHRSDKVCLAKELMEAQDRIRFLEGKLEKADDLIEATFRDLDRARRTVQDLSQRNVEMTWRVKDKRRDYTKEDYETGEVIVESYWMLKAGVYVGLFAFVFFETEYFLACVFFVWLILETNMTA
jgi:Kinesin motor domain